MNEQSHLFNLDPDVHYLNCAYMSPQLKSVTQAGIQGMQRKERPNTITSPDFFQDGQKLRSRFAELVNASPEQVFPIPSVSYGMAIMARNIPIEPGQEIVLIDEQFPSNAYPWMKVAEEKGAIIKMVEAPATFEHRGAAWNEALMKTITPGTAVVAMAHCHWADGTLFDLERIRNRTREIGAALVIDGTQSVGALPFDVDAIQPDALICGGYKWLLGPYSLGLGYIDPRYNSGEPLEESWINRKGSEDFAGLVDYEDTYQPGAGRFAVGEHSNFIMTPMLIASIEQLLTWQPAKIQEYCERLTAEGIRTLRDAGYWIEDDTHRGHHLFGINLPPHLDPEIIRGRLAENNVFVSVRGRFVRVAAHVFNTDRDIEALVNTLIHEARN